MCQTVYRRNSWVVPAIPSKHFIHGLHLTGEETTLLKDFSMFCHYTPIFLTQSKPKPAMKLIHLSLIVLLTGFHFSCTKDDPLMPPPTTYMVSGTVDDEDGEGIADIQISYGSQSTLTNTQGAWTIDGLNGTVTLRPEDTDYIFSPSEIQVSTDQSGLVFVAEPLIPSTERQITNWFENQQLANGLLESAENSNVVSLYDQALAAMVFMVNNDFTRAERIFDFFNARVTSELQNGVGGFSQFRDRNGISGNYRWMGDNAWLLIALNNYKSLTSNNAYDQMATAIGNWLMSLQDTDGGLFAGYDSNDNLLDYKVTEGNIDAFNALPGYTTFHEDLLGFLETDRWDDMDNNLMAWPENPPYRYALDNQTWSYCMFPDYPVSALTSADRFLTTQTATINGVSITGYDIDEDQDVVFLEGTGQMVLAFKLAGMQSESDLYLAEMEKILTASSLHTRSGGFPYVSNPGTGYGDVALWAEADTDIALSGGAWYFFGINGFNPFGVERNKNIPTADKFWIN